MRAHEIMEGIDPASISIKIEGSWKDRLFITAFEHVPEDRRWLNGDSIDIGDATVDIISDGSAYLNRIDITYGKGQGRGPVVVTKILAELQKHGISYVTAYVEHRNAISRSMFMKLGFTKMKSEDWDAQYGDYLRKDL